MNLQQEAALRQAALSQQQQLENNSIAGQLGGLGAASGGCGGQANWGFRNAIQSAGAAIYIDNGEAPDIKKEMQDDLKEWLKYWKD